MQAFIVEIGSKIVKEENFREMLSLVNIELLDLS